GRIEEGKHVVHPRCRRRREENREIRDTPQLVGTGRERVPISDELEFDGLPVLIAPFELLGRAVRLEHAEAVRPIRVAEPKRQTIRGEAVLILLALVLKLDRKRRFGSLGVLAGEDRAPRDVFDPGGTRADLEGGGRLTLRELMNEVRVRLRLLGLNATL